jgi:hypothetical protein
VTALVDRCAEWTLRPICPGLERSDKGSVTTLTTWCDDASWIDLVLEDHDDRDLVPWTDLRQHGFEGRIDDRRDRCWSRRRPVARRDHRGPDGGCRDQECGQQTDDARARAVTVPCMTVSRVPGHRRPSALRRDRLEPDVIDHD